MTLMYVNIHKTSAANKLTLAVEKKHNRPLLSLISHTRHVIEHNVTQSHSRNSQYINIKHWFSRYKTLAQPASMALIAFGVVSSFNVFVVYLETTKNVFVKSHYSCKRKERASSQFKS